MWKTVVSTVVILCLFTPGVFSDTVILRDGTRLKGLILDEFKDRIVVSTASGEKTIMKSDIQSAVYDNEAKALIRKAKNQIKRMNYIKAYHIYAKALELDPTMEEARDQYDFLKSFLETKMKSDIAKSVEVKREKFQGVEGKTLVAKVADELGIVLVPNGKYVCVERVVNGNMCPARPGDRIVSVWGELTAYMDADEVADAMLKPEECKIMIERAVKPLLSSNNSRLSSMLANGYEKIIGARLKLIKKGVIIENVVPGGAFQAAGVENGDILHRINGKNTRYMPMDRIIGTIGDSRGQEVDIVIRRNITLWRKREEI